MHEEAYRKERIKEAVLFTKRGLIGALLIALLIGFLESSVGYCIMLAMVGPSNNLVAACLLIGILNFILMAVIGIFVLLILICAKGDDKYLRQLTEETEAKEEAIASA